MRFRTIQLLVGLSHILKFRVSRNQQLTGLYSKDERRVKNQVVLYTYNNFLYNSYK